MVDKNMLKKGIILKYKRLLNIFFLILTVFCISVFFYILIYSNIVKQRNFSNYETESNLLFLHKDEQYDILFMGISHARNFSRHKNHLRIEKLLDKTLVNIAQGHGNCGVNEQLFYLDYFYFLNNKVDKVVYVFSPSMFFSKKLAYDRDTFDQEPVDLVFLTRYLFFKSENKFPRIFSYIVSKLKPSWSGYYPSSLDSKEGKLNFIDAFHIKEKRIDLHKKMKLDMQRFENSIKTVEQTIDFSLENEAEVVLFIPPALFGKWAGHEEVKNFALKMAEKDNVSFYDFSEAVLVPQYYYDGHHLNTEGIIYFTKKYLKPIL